LFDIDTNLKATIQLLEFTRKLIGKKVIYASSGGAVYGLAGDVKATERCPTNPISSYGIVKLACEKYLALFEHLYNLQYTVFRIANPFGPYQYGFKAQGAVAAFVQRSLTGQPIDIWGDGEVVRDYVYIKDVASALLSCCFYNGDRKMFNIGSGTGRSLNSLIQDIFRQTGKSVPVRYHERRKADVPHIVLDCTLAKKELSYSPAFSFEHGLQETIRWISQNLHG
jgi:UDP-glucose 4-epimerase